MRGIRGWTLAATLAALSVYASETEKSDVVSLTKSSFHDFVNHADLSLVEFFAPWCGHCQALAPHYEEAATDLLKQDIKLAKVDCTVEESLCSDNEVTGFPTLKVFRQGKASPYTGPRKTEGIVSYMLKQQMPAVSDVTADSLEDFKAKDKLVIVGYIDASDAKSQEELKAFAEDNRDTFMVGMSSSKELAAEQGVKVPSIVVYRTFDEPKAVQTPKGKTLTKEEIQSFINVESLPLIDEVNAENFMKYAMTGTPLAYYFVDPESPKREEEVKKLAEVAREFRGKVNLVWIDSVKFVQHAKALNLPGDSWPAFAIQNMETGAKYPLTNLGKDVAGSVRTFLTKFVAGKVQPSIKSAPVPSQSSSLIEVVSDEFDKWVLDDSRDVLLELFAPWCGHCKRLAPTYEKLAELYNSDADASKLVRIAKMDGTENDIPPHADITLTGFPTLVLKPAGKGVKEFIVYEGDRTLESLIDFIASKGKHKASVTVAPPSNDETSSPHDEL